MKKTLEWLDNADPYQLLVLLFVAGLVVGILVEFIRDAVKNR